MPMSRCAGGMAVMSAPSTSTVPASGVSKPATTLSSVVLPEPLGPEDGQKLARGDVEATRRRAPRPRRSAWPRPRPAARPSALAAATPYAFFSIQAFHSSMRLVAVLGIPRVV